MSFKNGIKTMTLIGVIPFFLMFSNASGQNNESQVNNNQTEQPSARDNDTFQYFDDKTVAYAFVPLGATISKPKYVSDYNVNYKGLPVHMDRYQCNRKEGVTGREGLINCKSLKMETQIDIPDYRKIDPEKFENLLANISFISPTKYYIIDIGLTPTLFIVRWSEAPNGNNYGNVRKSFEYLFRHTINAKKAIDKLPRK